MATWTGYLDAAGGDYSAGGLLLTVGSASASVQLVPGFAYLLTGSITMLWAAGGVSVTAGIAVPGTGLLAFGAGVVIEARGGTTHVAAIRVGTADGVMFLQRRALR